MNSKFIEDVKNICEKYEIDIGSINCLDDFNQLIKIKHSAIDDNNLRQEIEANKKYVNNYYRKIIKPYHGMFPETYRYYKVISERCDDKYHVSCLTFDEEPHYWFDYISHRIHWPGDYFLGNFQFNPIWIEELNVRDINKLEEITQYLYEDKMKEMVLKLLDINWEPDHYRYGNKFPSDEGWKEVDK